IGTTRRARNPARIAISRTGLGGSSRISAISSGCRSWIAWRSASEAPAGWPRIAATNSSLKPYVARTRKCLVQLIKDIDHPSIRIRKLDRLGNDRAQHGFEIKRGVDCPRHLAKRPMGLLESSTEMMLA